MSGWFVFDESGVHRGPVSVETLAAAVVAGDISPDALVAPSADAARSLEWRAASSVPEVAKRLPSRTGPPLAVVAGAFTPRMTGDPDFGATVMMMPKKSEKDQKGS